MGEGHSRGDLLLRLRGDPGMDPCLFFCHSQTSKNLDFRAKEPHLSQPKRRGNGGFRLDWSRNRSLLPKRGATSYFEDVLKRGGLPLKTASPARTAGRCERRWSHRFMPHCFRPPVSSQQRAANRLRWGSGSLSIGGGGAVGAQRRAHGLHTALFRLSWGTDATLPPAGHTGAATAKAEG